MAQQFGSPKNGDSAYQVAVNNGYSLSEAEWLKSLKSLKATGNATIANEFGQSPSEAVSQKLLTNTVGDIDRLLTELNGER